MKLSVFLEKLKKDLEIESKEKLNLFDDLIQLDEWDSLNLLKTIQVKKFFNNLNTNERNHSRRRYRI